MRKGNGERRMKTEMIAACRGPWREGGKGEGKEPKGERGRQASYEHAWDKRHGTRKGPRRGRRGRGGGVKGRKRGEGVWEKKKASKILQEIRDPKEGAFR